MKSDQLVKERGGLQGPVVVGQKQGQVKQGCPEVFLDKDRLSEPVFRRWYVALVHGQHAQIEKHPFVLLALKLHEKKIKRFEIFLLDHYPTP